MKWTAADNSVTTLVSSGLAQPGGLAVDGAGNVYIADTDHLAIKKWSAEDRSLTTLFEVFGQPCDVALYGASNVIAPDAQNDVIWNWSPANGIATVLTTTGSVPDAVKVDVAGNVYIANDIGDSVQKWSAASQTLSTLTSGVYVPDGLAVDGSGNVYIADASHYAIMEWTAANNTLTTFASSEVVFPGGVAVDGTGNVFIANYGSNLIMELPYAFVDPTPKLEGLSAGSDVLPGVLPATENLLPPFAPTSDQSWLTITGITNGVVNFSFTANAGPARTANISLLGQTIPVTQGTIGTPPILTGVQMLGGNVLQFNFSNTQTASLTVLSTTNMALPLSDWTVVGTAMNTAPGHYQFISQPTTNDEQRFYVVRSP